MRRLLARVQRTLDFVPMGADQVKFMESLETIIQKVSKSVLPLIAADITEKVENPDLGREGMSASQVLRMCMVKQMYRLSYRDLHDRVEDSILLRTLAGYEYEKVPCFKALQTNIKQVRDETWMVFNKALVKHGVAHEVDSHNSIRIDTTAVESNIHNPTDASLLWDTVRILVRLLKYARKVFPEAGVELHNRSKTVKKLLFKASNENNKSKRNELILDMARYASEACRYAGKAIKALKEFRVGSEINEAAKAAALTLKEYQGLGLQVIKQARKLARTGKPEDADKKVLSLFEPHTDLVVKGSRDCVFGHKISLTVGKRLIQDCQILDGNPADVTTLTDALDSFKANYRCVPQELSVDGGYASLDNAEAAASMGIQSICMTRGAGTEASKWLVEGEAKRLLQKFRAGVEGIISGVKRSVGMRRAMWRGFDGFCSYVWSSICAYNLKMIAVSLL